VVAFVRSRFKLFTLKFSNKSARTPSRDRPKTTQRRVFLLFEYNNCFPRRHQYRASSQFSHSTVHFSETTVLSIFAVNSENGKNRLSVINLFKQRDKSHIVWTFGKGTSPILVASLSSLQCLCCRCRFKNPPIFNCDVWDRRRR
jgi:hypothetical protein